MPTLRVSLSKLFRMVTAPGANFPVNDGSISSVAENGVAYHLAGLKRGGAPSVWWEGTLHAQRQRFIAEQQGTAAPDWRKTNPLLLVQWPYLLSKAELGGTHQMQGLAHEFLRMLVPLIEQFDTVLAWDIQEFEKRWAAKFPESAAMPFFHGQRHSDDEVRFNRHLLSLLRNKTFRRYLGETMETTLRHITASRMQHIIGLCPKQRHFRGQSCEACETQRWQRRYVTVLWPHLLLDVRAEWRFTKPDTFDATKNPWHIEFRNLLSTNHADEGVVRVGDDTLLVNFMRLRAHITELDRPSVFLREFIRPWPKDAWMQAFHTREALGREFPGLMSPRPKPLEELVTEAGWEWRETLDIPYELYSIPALLHRLSVGKMARQSLALVRNKPRLARRYQWATIHMPYVDALDQHHDVFVAQRNVNGKLTNFFSLPYTVTSDKATRRNVSLRVGDNYLWTLFGLHRHSKPLNDGTLPYAEAPRFLDWAINLDSYLTADEFKRIRFENRYAERIAEKQRGERKHIGRFAKYEDSVLREFFSMPRERRRLSKAEWSAILEKMPSRDQLGVTRRLEELGFQYALQHGWAAYVNSPWCLRDSPVRKKLWGKRGIGP